MRHSTILLVLAVMATACVTLSNADRYSSLPDNFIERVEAIVKWFELRISVYRKANMLLKQLTRKVSVLQPHNDGIDVYYRRWREYPEPPTLAMFRGALNGTRKAAVSDQLRKVLDEKEVKFILTMMPEVYSAFHKKA